MELWLNSLFDIIPIPILIGMLIWTCSMCLFSLFLLIIFILLNKRCSNISELISIKEISTNIERNFKDHFSCDSLSLMSCETTKHENLNKIDSFYLKSSLKRKDNSTKINSLPSIKLNQMINENRKLNTLPQLSTKRSIIRDLTSASNSFNEKKLHQSIDSLFSKDSLIE